MKHIDKKADGENHFRISGNKIESSNLVICWDENGHLTSVMHKGANREVLTGKGNVLEIFEDKPRFFDAWEMESTIDYKKETVNELISVQTAETGPHFAKVSFKWKYNNSTIDQDMSVYHDSDRIDL